ncbi:MAG: hypothetical protein P1U39_08820 [Legionellaceae bacterium]|nr:hypothetical protein [Legionellaceae bacterium]
MPSQTPRITGLLFNCAMNCALPRLLENIDRLATLEQTGDLPASDDPTYAHYERLKTIFMTHYGQHDHANCTWEFFSNFLKKYSFYGQELMFMPIFRIFIAEIGLQSGEYYSEDLWSLRDLQAPNAEHDAIYTAMNQKNPAIGRYSNLEISTVHKLFYAPLAIGNFKLYEYQSDDGQYHEQATGVVTIPSWLNPVDDDLSFSMYLHNEHYELLSHMELGDLSAQYDQEVRLLPRGLHQVHDILSSSGSAEQSSIGLAHLVLYVHDELEKALHPDQAPNTQIDYNTYRNTTAWFYDTTTAGPSQETFARILLAVATRTPELKPTASRLFNMPHLSPDLVALLVNQAHDLEALFHWVDAQNEKLRDAVEKHDPDQAQQAIAAGADVNARIPPENSQLESEITPLLNIVARSKPDNDEMARILIYAGADMGALDANGNTLLLNAIAVGNVKFAHTYMEQLHRIKPEKRAAILEHKVTLGDSSYTALEFAIRRGFSTLAITMIQAGANPNPTGNTASPLQMACMLLGYASMENQYTYAPLDLITTLLDHGAEAPEHLFDDYLTVNSAPPDELFEGIDERDIQLGDDFNRRHTYLSSEAYDKIHQPKIQQALERRMKLERERHRITELPAEESKTPDVARSIPEGNQPSPAAQGIFSPPTPAVTNEQRAKLKENFEAACTKMTAVLDELCQASKITDEKRRALGQKIEILHNYPESHQAFLQHMQQCEDLVGSKFLAYCMLAAGYAAKLCTFGYYGKNWIEQANQKLGHIQVAAEFKAEGEAFYRPSAR